MISVFSISMVKADPPAFPPVANTIKNGPSFLPSVKDKFFSQQTQVPQLQLTMLKKRDQRLLEKESISYNKESHTKGIAPNPPVATYCWTPLFLYQLLLFPNHYFW